MRVGPVGRPAASFRRQSVAVQGIVSRPVFWAVSTAWPSASTTCRNSSALMQIWAARARLTVASATSSQLSAGVRPPAAGVYQRVRSSSRRSLTVRTVWGSRPLFCRRRPSGAFGGGKSRFRGINLELQGGLVGVTAEVGEEVANLLLTGVDNVAGRGLVDGVGDTTAEFLEAAAQALQEGVGGNGWQGVHRGSGCYMKEKRLSELTVSIGNARKICRARPARASGFDLRADPSSSKLITTSAEAPAAPSGPAPQTELDKQGPDGERRTTVARAVRGASRAAGDVRAPGAASAADAGPSPLPSPGH